MRVQLLGRYKAGGYLEESNWKGRKAQRRGEGVDEKGETKTPEKGNWDEGRKTVEKRMRRRRRQKDDKYLSPSIGEERDSKGRRARRDVNRKKAKESSELRRKEKGR